MLTPNDMTQCGKKKNIDIRVNWKMKHWPEVKKLANFAHKWGKSSLNCTLKKTDLSKIIQSKKIARLKKISKENTLARIGLQTKIHM
jgi:hypothetical protein